MVISYSHKFIFIHLYKVAGVSISEALEKYVYNHLPGKIIRKSGISMNLPRCLHRFNVFHKHITARELKKLLPYKIYDNFYKFGFVRNPWDWQVSLYHYALKNSNHHQHNLIKAMKGFDEYIEWRVFKDKKLQKYYFTDDDGPLIVDFIGKLENISKDILHICNVLNIDISLKHLNKSEHRNYRSYYNKMTIKLVEEHFKEDIEFFGYTFD